MVNVSEEHLSRRRSLIPMATFATLHTLHYYTNYNIGKVLWGHIHNVIIDMLRITYTLYDPK